MAAAAAATIQNTKQSIEHCIALELHNLTCCFDSIYLQIFNKFIDNEKSKIKIQCTQKNENNKKELKAMTLSLFWGNKAK